MSIKLPSLLSPEARLLFLAANEGSSDLEIRALLDTHLDWVQLARLADREKAVPLVWRRIQNAPSQAVPVVAAEHLRKLARVISFHMSYLEHLVLRSVSALDHARIDYVLLKGAALACSVYESFTDRPMIDVDLLVREEDANATVDALLSAGWVWRADKPRDGNFSHLHHLPALLDPNGLVSVEIHKSLLPHASPFGISTDAVLRSSRAVSFRDSEVRVPDPLYLLLHACIHFSWSHLFRTGALRTFRDVQAIIDGCNLEWDQFVDLADRHRATTCCFWTLHLARELIGAKVPDEVLTRLRPSLPGAVLRTLERHFTLILLPSSGDCPSVSLRRVMWTVGMLPRRSGHARSRPWEVLALRPEDRAVREARLRTGKMKVSDRWARYWSSLLLAAPQQR